MPSIKIKSIVTIGNRRYQPGEIVDDLENKTSRKLVDDGQATWYFSLPTVEQAVCNPTTERAVSPRRKKKKE